MEPIKLKREPFLRLLNGKRRLIVIFENGVSTTNARMMMMNFLHAINLPKKFAVHHINGVSDDDRMENLQLLSRKEHVALHHPRGYKYGEGVCASDDRLAYQRIINRIHYAKNRLNPVFMDKHRKLALEYFYKKRSLKNATC